MEEPHYKVLLVEDIEYHAELIEEYLADGGDEFATLVRAGSLAECLEKLAGGGFDLALLDLGLPDSKGLETLAAVLPVAGDTPIIVLTARAEPELGVEAIRAGAQDYLAKGQINPETLRKAIEYAVARTERVTQA